ncbi:hypothetical protein BC830DRAFT_1089889 [Chytriomyces sp. MP71]|nr:hypothetical protein BC830DRAFT_1089889 [Chytriomyces sp. MP71]
MQQCFLPLWNWWHILCVLFAEQPVHNHRDVELVHCLDFLPSRIHNWFAPFLCDRWKYLNSPVDYCTAWCRITRLDWSLRKWKMFRDFLSLW